MNHSLAKEFTVEEWRVLPSTNALLRKDTRLQGEAMFVDAMGKVLSRRGLAEGAGVMIADIKLAAQPQRSLPISQRFWLPVEMPEQSKESWKRWFTTGSRYYGSVTNPYLESGEINEFIPGYLL